MQSNKRSTQVVCTRAEEVCKGTRIFCLNKGMETKISSKVGLKKTFLIIESSITLFLGNALTPPCF